MALILGGVMPVFDKGGVRHVVGGERDYIRGEHPTTICRSVDISRTDQEVSDTISNQLLIFCDILLSWMRKKRNSG